jgi:hypothetical protein
MAQYQQWAAYYASQGQPHGQIDQEKYQQYLSAYMAAQSAANSGAAAAGGHPLQYAGPPAMQQHR